MLDFFKQPGIYECSFYLLGWFSYRIVANALKVPLIYSFASKISKVCYLLIISTNQQILSAIELKEDILSSSDYPSDLLNEQIQEDKDAVRRWKEKSIDELYQISLDEEVDRLK